MQGSRTLQPIIKPRIILDKSFPITRELEVGDKGQVLITGVIDSERIDTQPDGTEIFIKTIRLENVELITNKTARQYA